ncbi:MAG: MFS transporter [Solirubrobacteraceae bacterium]
MSRLLDARCAPGSLWHVLLSEPRRPRSVRESPHAHWYVVGTVCVGAFMGQLDASIVTLALSRLGRDLHASVGAVEWVALAYLLVLVASVATVGRLADAVGRKLLYVYGFGVFTAGSVLCGLAPTLPVLVAARVLQAVGAAMLQANSVALIAEAMPRRLLGRGIGVQGTAQALGLALGPVVGGALLALGGWRLIFLVNLPAGAIGLALGWFLLPRSRSRRAAGAGDQLGAVLLALGAAGPLVYLSLGSRAGYGSPLLLAALAIGVLAAVGFVRRERRVDAPLIELSMLRRPALSVGLSSGLISYLVLFGTLFVVPYYLSAKHVGFALVGLQLSVLPVAIGIAAPVAGRLLSRTGDRPLTGGGMLLTAAGLLEIAVWHGITGLLAGLALTGLGLGAFTPANNATIMSASPPGHAGVISGVLNMTRGMGTALGVALAGALYSAIAGAAGVPTTHAAAAHGLSVTLAALGSLALAVGLMLLLGRSAVTAISGGGHRSSASSSRRANALDAPITRNTATRPSPAAVELTRRDPSNHQSWTHPNAPI